MKNFFCICKNEEQRFVSTAAGYQEHYWSLHFNSLRKPNVIAARNYLALGSTISKAANRSHQIYQFLSSTVLILQAAAFLEVSY
jgi:hypothetical protein